MSLNLSPEPARYTGSPIFNDAVNDAQFVRTFGIIALIGSLLILISGGVAIGLGLTVMGFGTGRYFKALGGTVLVLGIASLILVGFASALVGTLGALALGTGVGWKAMTILGVLGREGREDPDWGITHRRALVGIVCGGLGALISLCFGLVLVVALTL